MTKINHVYYHPSFEYGTTDKPHLTDKTMMRADEKLALIQWVATILTGGQHEGKNKPSWIRNGRDIPNAKAYKDNNIWHYHCGAYTSIPINYRPTDNILSENNNGKSSSEIYHYAKHQDTIIVIGYSRIHLPFPDAMSTKNQLRGRSYSLNRALPQQ